MLSLGSFFHFTQREFRKCWTKTPQMDPTCKSVIATLKFLLILPKMLDEMFDGDQTSSNIIQNDFFLLFVFFENFRHLQCVQHFIHHTKFAMLDAFEPALIIQNICSRWYSRIVSQKRASVLVKHFSWKHFLLLENPMGFTGLALLPFLTTWLYLVFVSDVPETFIWHLRYRHDKVEQDFAVELNYNCLLYTSPSPRDS